MLRWMNRRDCCYLRDSYVDVGVGVVVVVVVLIVFVLLPTLSYLYLYPVYFFFFLFIFKYNKIMIFKISLVHIIIYSISLRFRIILSSMELLSIVVPMCRSGKNTIHKEYFWKSNYNIICTLLVLVLVFALAISLIFPFTHSFSIFLSFCIIHHQTRISVRVAKMAMLRYSNS